MTTYFTKNPLGSSSPYDLFDNSQNFDTAVNTITAAIWQDRFGKNRLTWYGIESLAMQSMLNYGYITAKSFEQGYTLLTPNTVLQLESNGEYYRWDGDWSQPKVVPPGSTPESAGGVGPGKWVGVGDAALRTQLSDPDGVGKYPELQIARWRDEGDVRGWGIAPGSKDNVLLINKAITDLSLRGGGELLFRTPGVYLISVPIVPRRGVLCKTSPGTVTIKLANNSNTGMVESYKFDALRANSAHSIADDPDFTQDYGFDGFIFDGNGANQSTATLKYGVKMYGLRLTLKRCIIHNFAGVGLLTAHVGVADDNYTVDMASIPACIDELEIINSFDENWIYEGPSDTPIGSVVTNENGDKNNPGTTPQTSRHFPGEPVHSVVVAANKAMQADYLNLNSPRFGKCFVVKDNSRLTIDTLITAGGWGNVEFGVNCNGVVKNNFSQANKINWGGITRPFVLNHSNKLVITDTIIRRASGQDVGADGVFDSGGANWGTVANLQAATQGGHLFIADAVSIMIGQLKSVGIGSVGSDGLASAALVTTENCDQLNCTMTFSNVSLVWRNKKNGLIGNFIAAGDVGTGNNFAEGLTGTPALNKSSLMTMQAVFKDGAGDVKTNNFIGSGNIDLTSTGGKTVTIPHTLWRAPSVEEIQATLRHGSFTAPGTFSPVYISSFNATQVVLRVDVTAAATGTPISQVVCRIN
ncbi:hypothetical protein GNG27_14585 [Leclercia sp. 119287]|uniref:tail fiber/spike domain-containing protein n=1 Tax=Leclercia sp. 119287 TaxID=2681308 RepID=UPI0012E0E8EB|nr:hypothetical protein [Leclercia sp. 119287]QGU15836.1 hypothetical protein GNG27_14585 [Leclercia sp. 119287]